MKSFSRQLRSLLLHGLQDQRQAGGLSVTYNPFTTHKKLTYRCDAALVPILQKARFQIQRKGRHAEGPRRINGIFVRKSKLWTCDRLFRVLSRDSLWALSSELAETDCDIEQNTTSGNYCTGNRARKLAFRTQKNHLPSPRSTQFDQSEDRLLSRPPQEKIPVVQVVQTWKFGDVHEAAVIRGEGL